MKTVEEVEQLASEIPISSILTAKAWKAMAKKVGRAKKNGDYTIYNGVPFHIGDDLTVWIRTNTINNRVYWSLSEKGHLYYCGDDSIKCAEMLYKVSAAHKMLGK